MRGVDAPGRFAQVIERHAGGDWPDVELVGHPVRKRLCPSFPDLASEVSVSVCPDSPAPDPTIIFSSELGFKPGPLVLRLRSPHTTKYSELLA